MIGGNTTLKLLIKTRNFTLNSIGERVSDIKLYKEITGFLDLSTVDAKHTVYNSKIQESDHIFICDYVEIEHKTSTLVAECNGNRYEVLMVDDPMGLHEHLEIYLRYIGE